MLHHMDVEIAAHVCSQSATEAGFCRMSCCVSLLRRCAGAAWTLTTTYLRTPVPRLHQRSDVEPRLRLAVSAATVQAARPWRVQTVTEARPTYLVALRAAAMAESPPGSRWARCQQAVMCVCAPRIGGLRRFLQVACVQWQTCSAGMTGRRICGTMRCLSSGHRCAALAWQHYPTQAETAPLSAMYVCVCMHTQLNRCAAMVGRCLVGLKCFWQEHGYEPCRPPCQLEPLEPPADSLCLIDVCTGVEAWRVCGCRMLQQRPATARMLRAMCRA